MSIPNMVADTEKEKNDMMGLPMFDSTNVVTWSKRPEDVVDEKKAESLGLREQT